MLQLFICVHIDLWQRWICCCCCSFSFLCSLFRICMQREKMTCFTFSAMLYCVHWMYALCCMACMFQLKYNLCSKFQPFFCLLAATTIPHIYIACVRQSMNRNHKKHTLTAVCIHYNIEIYRFNQCYHCIDRVQIKKKKNRVKKVGSIENRRSFDSLTTVRAFLSTFVCVLAIHCAKHGILPWHVCTLCSYVCVRARLCTIYINCSTNRAANVELKEKREKEKTIKMAC